MTIWVLTLGVVAVGVIGLAYAVVLGLKAVAKSIVRALLSL